MKRIFPIILITAIMYVIVHLIEMDISTFQPAKVTLYFGFLLIISYMVGEFFASLNLPKITGYILTGVLFGPSVTGIITPEITKDLKLIDSLALTFIALVAGGELILEELKAKLKSMIYLLIFTTSFIIVGVFTSTFIVSNFHGFFKQFNPITITAICLIIGTLSAARSPSSAIAIINETRASGPYTRTILGVTVALDIITIILFAIVISISKVLVTPGETINLNYLSLLLLSLIASIVIGILLGTGVSYYIKKVNLDLPVLLLILAFVITKISYGISDFIAEQFHIYFHLEPLLIAITIGFYIQNFSKKGKIFIKSLEKSSLIIYVIFFAMTGVSLRISVLKTAWFLGIFLFLIRTTMLISSSYIAGTLSKDPPLFKKLTGIGLITQAGVSIGLANEIARRFPEWGYKISTVIIAVITLNQIIGPITFKYALQKIGEAYKSKY